MVNMIDQTKLFIICLHGPMRVATDDLPGGGEDF